MAEFTKICVEFRLKFAMKGRFCGAFDKASTHLAHFALNFTRQNAFAWLLNVREKRQNARAL